MEFSLLYGYTIAFIYILRIIKFNLILETRNNFKNLKKFKVIEFEIEIEINLKNLSN
jgi:hypothetical protein